MAELFMDLYVYRAGINLLRQNRLDEARTAFDLPIENGGLRADAYMWRTSPANGKFRRIS
jgi:hypothetical protein